MQYVLPKLPLSQMRSGASNNIAGAGFKVDNIALSEYLTFHKL